MTGFLRNLAARSIGVAPVAPPRHSTASLDPQVERPAVASQPELEAPAPREPAVTVASSARPRAVEDNPPVVAPRPAPAPPVVRDEEPPRKEPAAGAADEPPAPSSVGKPAGLVASLARVEVTARVTPSPLVQKPPAEPPPPRVGAPGTGEPRVSAETPRVAAPPAPLPADARRIVDPPRPAARPPVAPATVASGRAEPATPRDELRAPVRAEVLVREVSTPTEAKSHQRFEAGPRPVAAPQPPRRPAPPLPSELRASEAEPAIEVRIGRVEVRAPRPPEQQPLPPAPAPPLARDFADFALSRRGLDRRWY